MPILSVKPRKYPYEILSIMNLVLYLERIHKEKKLRIALPRGAYLGQCKKLIAEGYTLAQIRDQLIEIEGFISTPFTFKYVRKRLNASDNKING